MRVYLPSTLARLARAHTAGELAGPTDAHAVTGAVREWYTSGDLEELEYAAFTEAAEASLRLLATDGGPHRRVVVAADVPDGAVRPRAGESYRSAVTVASSVPLRAVASVHVDEVDAQDVVADAVRSLPAADGGDDDARFALDEAEATELLWYDVTEIPDLLSPPTPPPGP